jgi:hypothetical protein
MDRTFEKTHSSLLSNGANVLVIRIKLVNLRAILIWADSQAQIPRFSGIQEARMAPQETCRAGQEILVSQSEVSTESKSVKTLNENSLRK